MYQSKYLLTALLIAFVCKAFAQIHTIDTIIDKKQYGFAEYYANGKLKALGNYTDTMKTGDWIYFTCKGLRLAYGKYKDNYKYGNWTYQHSKNVYKVKWTDNNRPNEKFEYDKKGNLIIIDIIYVRPCLHYYRNGFPSMTARLM
ncbi:MAG: hypothetical protein V4651_09710 [Bacteroidota bacterium]